MIDNFKKLPTPCGRCRYSCRCCTHCFENEEDEKSACHNCFPGKNFSPVNEEFINHCPFKEG